MHPIYQSLLSLSVLTQKDLHRNILCVCAWGGGTGDSSVLLFTLMHTKLSNTSVVVFVWLYSEKTGSAEEAL